MPERAELGSIGVVGAGFAGLTLADALRNLATVTVLDKGRGVGGRLSTRRGEGVHFNHGAQYFTASTRPFQQRVREWVEQGLVRLWDGRLMGWDAGRFTDAADGRARYHACPGNNALAKHLSKGLRVRTGVTIVRVRREDQVWILTDSTGQTHGPFQTLVLANPAPQALALLGGDDPFAAALRRVRIDPCWAVMIRFDRDPGVGFDALRIAGMPLAWVMRTPDPTESVEASAWVAHADHRWSVEHLECPADQIPQMLTPALAQIFGDRLADATLVAHRWRYAHVVDPLGQPCVWDPTRRLGLVGDWCIGPKVESAFLSGMAMVEKLAGSIAPGQAGDEPRMD